MPDQPDNTSEQDARMGAAIAKLLKEFLGGKEEIPFIVLMPVDDQGRGLRILSTLPHDQILQMMVGSLELIQEGKLAETAALVNTETGETHDVTATLHTDRKGSKH